MPCAMATNSIRRSRTSLLLEARMGAGRPSAWSTTSRAASIYAAMLPAKADGIALTGSLGEPIRPGLKVIESFVQVLYREQAGVRRGLRRDGQHWCHRDDPCC